MDTVIIDYTNWRGVRRLRRIKPLHMQFESNEWHKEPQWLIYARDLDGDGSVKTFAWRDIHSVTTAIDILQQVVNEHKPMGKGQPRSVDAGEPIHLQGG